MTWVKVDDKLTTHPKWVGLTLQAKSLWLHAAVWCGAHNNDGVIPDHVMPLVTFQSSLAAPEMAPACDALVKARLWKRIPKGKGGGYEIVNWLDFQPSKQQVKDKANNDDVKAERKLLHDWLHKAAVGKRVKALIDARDGLWCRYCSTETIITPGDRRGPHRRTYDLVDPSSTWDRTSTALPDTELARLADMWVVACGWCNAVKDSRTPDEAGMELLPAKTFCRVLPRSAANGSRAVREVGTGLSGSDLVGPARDGSGRGEAGSTTGSHPMTDLLRNVFPGSVEVGSTGGQ